MPAAEYLRRLFLHDDLAEGRLPAGGRPVATGDIRVPFFVVRTETDHIAPWRSVHRLHLRNDGNLTFALTSGGHNAGVVSEPGRPHRHYRLRERPAGSAHETPEGLDGGGGWRGRRGRPPIRRSTTRPAAMYWSTEPMTYVSPAAMIENRVFSELALGDTASLSRTATQQDIEVFAVVPGNVSPAHMDPAYAATDVFHHVIAHGLLSTELISNVLGTKLPGPGTIYLAQDPRFLRPVAIGDTVTALHAEKGIVSPVAGQADILVAPDIEARNMLAKQLTFLAHADAGRTRIASCAVAVLLARSAASASAPVEAC